MKKQGSDDLMETSARILEILSEVEDKRSLITILSIQLAHVLMVYYKKSSHGRILIHMMNNIINRIDEAEEVFENEEENSIKEQFNA